MNSTDLAITTIGSAINEFGLSFLYVLIVGVLTYFAFKQNSHFLMIVSASALTFLGIYWIFTYKDYFGLAFCFILIAIAGYVFWTAIEPMVRGKK